MEHSKNINKLLIDEHPLQVLPSLAVAIGLNEAIIVQQMHYWIRQSSKLQDGRVWTYNTIEAWRGQFPFWSERTIRRTIKELEDKGILTARKFGSAKWDHMKWHTINYEKMTEMADRSGQIGHMEPAKLDASDPAKLAASLKTETSSEINPETSGEESAKASSSLEALKDLWNKELPDEIPKLKGLSKPRRDKLRARLAEGMKLEEIIDHIKRSPFLLGKRPGKDGKTWIVKFDWIIENGNNWLKVIEGNYDDKQASSIPSYAKSDSSFYNRGY